MGKGSTRNVMNKKEILDNITGTVNGTVYRPFDSGNIEIIRGNFVILAEHTFVPLDLSRILRISSANTNNFDIKLLNSFAGPSSRKFMVINESDATIRISPQSPLTLNYSASTFTLVKNTLYEIYRVSVNSYVIK